MYATDSAASVHPGDYILDWSRLRGVTLHILSRSECSGTQSLCIAVECQATSTAQPNVLAGMLLPPSQQVQTGMTRQPLTQPPCTKAKPSVPVQPPAPTLDWA